MNRKSNLILNIIVIFLTIIMSLLAYFNYKNKITMNFIVEKDSYPYKYVKDLNLKKEVLSSEEANKYNLYYESFLYEKDLNIIKLLKYEGVSEDLVIPRQIDGTDVVALDSSLVFGNPDVKRIYLSENIKDFDIDSLKDLEINCFKNTFCDELIKNKELNVKYINDEDKINFDNSASDFIFDIRENKVNILKYNGKKDLLIIPNTINGYPVSTLSFEKGDILNIYIPSTVEYINQFESTLAIDVFIYSFMGILISATVFLLVNLLNDKKNYDSLRKTIIINILSLIYLGLVYFFSLTINDYFEGFKKYILIISLITLIYLNIVILITFIKKKKEEVNKRIESTFIKDALDILKESKLEEKTDLEHLIRYSEISYIGDVDDLEEEILKELRILSFKNLNNVKNKVNERNLKLLLKKDQEEFTDEFSEEEFQ